MHHLLAEALAQGPAASGRSHPDGTRVEVESEPGLDRYDLLLGETDRLLAMAWRVEARAERPQGLPQAIPFVPRLSCVASVEPTGLTVTWPDLQASPIPGISGAPGRRAGDPGLAARSVQAAGGLGDVGGILAAAFQDVLDQSVARGWFLEGEERLAEPFPARVARLALGDGSRTLTWSVALGMAALVLLEPAHGPVPEGG